METAATAATWTAHVDPTYLPGGEHHDETKPYKVSTLHAYELRILDERGEELESHEDAARFRKYGEAAALAEHLGHEVVDAWDEPLAMVVIAKRA